MKDLKIALEGWFVLELYDHCQKGLAVFAIIWKSVSGETVFSSNAVSELRLTFSVAIDHVESSLQLLHEVYEGKASA